MDSAFLANLITPVALVLIAVGVGGVSFLGMRAFATASRRRERLAGGPAVSGPIDSGGGVSEALSGVIGGVRRLGDRMAIQDPAQLSALRAKLVQAGYYSREAAAIYLGARAACMIVAIVAMVLMLPYALSKGGGMGAIALGAVIALASIMGPDQVVKNRRKKRELEYREGFPDLLDLLVASVEAGLSLDAAVSRVTEELQRRYPDMADHLRVLTLELRAGRSRKDAWTAFAERLGIDEARSLFIFPCLIGVLMLPAIYKIKETLMK